MRQKPQRQKRPNEGLHRPFCVCRCGFRDLGRKSFPPEISREPFIHGSPMYSPLIERDVIEIRDRVSQIMLIRRMRADQ